MAPYIPDVGDTFTTTHTWTWRRWQWKPYPWYAVHVHTETSSYRVSSWMRRRSPLPPPQTEEEAFVRRILDEVLAEEGIERGGHGPDNVRLEFCHREEAEYVNGVGVGGTIQRVSDITVTGRVSWDEETIQVHRDLANMLAEDPVL